VGRGVRGSFGVTDAKTPWFSRGTDRDSGTIVERAWPLPALRRYKNRLVHISSHGYKNTTSWPEKGPYQGRIKPCADMGRWLMRLNFLSPRTRCMSCALFKYGKLLPWGCVTCLVARSNDNDGDEGSRFKQECAPTISSSSADPTMPTQEKKNH